MSDIVNKIINLIEENRISSTEVADALGKSGVLKRITPLSPGKHVCGKVRYSYVFDGSNWPLHEQTQQVEKGVILYVDTFNCEDKAVFGDLVAKYLLLYSRLKAVIVNGFLRDVPNLKKHNYAVWCTGVTPLGCFNKPVTPSDSLLLEIEKRKKEFEGAVMVCDDSGCTLIAPEKLTEETYRKLNLIELQEDIWFYCIDTLKWNTYETVCLKNYLKNNEMLPKVFLDKLSDFNLEQ